MANWLKLIISLALPQLVGGLGAFFTFSSVKTWFPTLIKPGWNPPSWLFGPVWTLLYILMGIACFLIWKSDHPQKKAMLKLYTAQLVLNALWSPAFFGMQSPLLGLLVIIPLWVAIVLCIIQFRKASPLSSGLMVPYLLWVTFATALNTAILAMN
ncbi:TspO/MBR family protein [Algoriphagus boritolerans]|uniref:TspO and MBR related proteins n=1 Tax=Algoriphagus boritolerans DSM 17298 = JCM 18970 TaxID=1120964 RepID=A0A1H5V8H8_9BACT|nr:TspO/MBR family protein [Algoriphagus boritolerans]SEF82757.1 TspO and MBR related proteins [Algoriphagus boritolerans DSM 17298 = JCM 18970]